MTSTPLKSISKTRFFENFFLSLKSNKKILTVMSVLHLLGLPLLEALLVMVAADNGDNYLAKNAFLVIGIFCFCAAVFCGIIMAINNFSYLYKKSQVDMIYSLPIKRNHKFMSDFFAGLAGYIIPYIVACILGDIILIGGSIFVDDIKNILDELGLFIVQCEFAGLFVMTMLYTLTVLVLCCCGSFFESCMNIVMINAVIPGAIAVIAVMFFANLYGVPVFDTILPVLGYTSPIGAMIYFVYYMDNGMYYNNSDCIDGALYAKWIVFFLLFTVAYFALSMFLYKKRKAEDVSKPYVFKLLYYILITVITMTICLIARAETEVIIPVALFAFIIYMIFEVITNRGFKKFYKSIIRYAATMLGILVVCTVADKTNGFGVQDKVYSPSKVKSVELSYCGIDEVIGETGGYYSYYNNIFLGEGQTIGAYTDKGIIETVTNVQRQALETYRSRRFETYDDLIGSYYIGYYDSENYSYDKDTPAYDMKFKFNLKSGKSVTRYYCLSFEQLKQLFVLDSTEQIAQYRADKLMESLEIYIPIENTNKYDIGYEVFYATYPDENNMIGTSLTKEEAKELVECYKLDYLESSTDELMNSKPVCYIGANYGAKYPVREKFSRTIDFIRMHGGLESSSYHSTYLYVAEGRLYKPEGYECWGGNEITATFGQINAKKGFSHEISNQDTKKLMEYAYHYYYAYEDCYVLELNGKYYAIPEKYSDIAEAIYNAKKTISHDYTSEMFMEDLRNCNSPEEYMNKYCCDYLDEGYDPYNDIYQAFDMRYFTDDTTVEEAVALLYDIHVDYESGNEYIEELLSNRKLLMKFFNFVSVDDYISYMEQNNMEVDKNTVYGEWAKYQEAFPVLSQIIIEN